jgi:hypothetical protein
MTRHALAVGDWSVLVLPFVLVVALCAQGGAFFGELEFVHGDRRRLVARVAQTLLDGIVLEGALTILIVTSRVPAASLIVRGWLCPRCPRDQSST